MKAVFINKSRKLVYQDVPKPSPKKGEALIKVRASALNHLDLHVVNGVRKTKLPYIPGSDVSGIVEEIREKSKFKLGDEVVVNPSIPCKKCTRCKKRLPCEIAIIFGFKTQGGWAEYVTVPIEQVYKKPENLSHIEVAAFPLTFLTAYHMLVGRAKLQRGETVFIWGASGGLGIVAIQIAKYLSAKVIAAVGSGDDGKMVKKIGADNFVNYKKQNIEKEVGKLTKGENVDVVFESVGVKTWKTSLAILKPYGRVVIAGTTTGAVASQDLSDVYFYQQTILGSRMGTKEEFEEVLNLVERGKLKPVVDKVFKLKDADKALKRLSESRQIGKIVLDV